MTVLIAGAGIGGLTLALSLHQIGVPCRVFESVERLEPLGVGINTLPHAVRELTALGLADRLAETAIETAELAYFSRHGTPVWAEPRGRAAGYNWPQFSVHRGALQTLLLQAVRERLGDDARPGAGRAVERSDEGERLKDKSQRRGENTEEREAIGSPDNEVEEDHRPAQEDKDLEEIGERAGVEGVAAQDEKTGLKGEAAGHCGKIEPGRLIPAGPQDKHRVGEADKKTEGGCSEQDAVFHWRNPVA